MSTSMNRSVNTSSYFGQIFVKFALCKVYYQLFDMLNEYVELMNGKCEKKFKNKMGNKIKRQINYFKNKLKCSNLQYTDISNN